MLIASFYDYHNVFCNSVDVATGFSISCCVKVDLLTKPPRDEDCHQGEFLYRALAITGVEEKDKVRK